MILKIDTYSVMVIYLNWGMSHFYTGEQRQDRKDICPAARGCMFTGGEKDVKEAIQMDHHYRVHVCGYPLRKPG